MLRPRSSPKSSSKPTISLAFEASSESSATLACKKKLYACRPRSVPQQIETQWTRRKQRTEPCDPASLERAVRQLLADKISGNQVGIWLLAPEHLRMGTWDLLYAWSQSGGQTIWPRMALHLVHEAAFKIRRASGHIQAVQRTSCRRASGALSMGKPWAMLSWPLRATDWKRPNSFGPYLSQG
jgi:hypothetical protein